MIQRFQPRRVASAPLVLLALSTVAGSSVAAQDARLTVDTAIVTQHSVTIRGVDVPYRATVGTQPVFGNQGEPIASLLYTFYERTDTDDRTTRPLVVSFNGGPGSASIWMHIGYTGPKQLIIDDEGYPVQPFGIRDNPHSILDVVPDRRELRDDPRVGAGSRASGGSVNVSEPGDPGLADRIGRAP